MMPNTFKRILCAVMALVLMVALLPTVAVTAEAAGTTDAAIFFSDLHTQQNNYKTQTISDVFGAVQSAGFPVSSVTSVGDAFSVNDVNQWFPGYTGLTSEITGAIQSKFNVPVNYVWSDHDRLAVKEDGKTLLDKTSRLVYGDASTNYYVYALSMADISTNDRYNAGFGENRAANGFTPTVEEAITNFKATVTTLDKSKPLFITSHVPLIDRRDDNGYAYAWATAINEVAATMDVIFLSGHNHSHDEPGDYYIAKDSTVDIATTNNIGTPNKVDLEGMPVTLNFTHLTAGYLAPGTTGSAGNSRQGTVIVASITDDSIQLTTYCATGEYTATYAVDESVDRDHAHKHNYTVESFASSCTEDGCNVYTCVGCGHSYIEVLVEAPGHNFLPTVIAPTCTDAGYTLYTCEECGDWYQDEEVDALGHDYTAVVTPPTADTQGYTTYTCNRCYDKYVGDFVEALGHKYTVVVKAPTCTSSGYTSYTCQDCGHRYNDNYVSAPGHNSTVVVTAPTCTEQGYSTFTCMDCGNVTIGNYVAEKGHVYNCVQSGDLLTYNCKNCNHSYSMAAESEYSYNKVTKLANNNTYVITMYVNKQYYALSHKGNQISAVPVTVANNKVMASDVTADILWTCQNNKLSYTYNGITRYLNASSTRLSVGGSGATVSFSSSKLKIGTNYLRYANGSVSLNRTASTTYLFNQVEN